MDLLFWSLENIGSLSYIYFLSVDIFHFTTSVNHIQTTDFILQVLGSCEAGSGGYKLSIIWIFFLKARFVVVGNILSVSFLEVTAHFIFKKKFVKYPI